MKFLSRAAHLDLARSVSYRGAMSDHITTIDDLARLIQNTMASKEDVQTLDKKVTEGFERVDSRLDHLDARVGRIEADIHELRGEIVYRHEFDDALARLKYLEKKLGIESGV
jgi:tetrahydromethanopterin S-methyltransferase subunit G